MVRFLDFRLFTTASFKSEVLQAKENSIEFPSNRRLIYFLIDERSKSKSVEEIVLQVRLDSSFAVFIAMYKASQRTLTQRNKPILIVLSFNYKLICFVNK